MSNFAKFSLAYANSTMYYANYLYSGNLNIYSLSSVLSTNSLYWFGCTFGNSVFKSTYYSFYSSYSSLTLVFNLVSSSTNGLYKYTIILLLLRWLLFKQSIQLTEYCLQGTSLDLDLPCGFINQGMTHWVSGIQSRCTWWVIMFQYSITKLT